MAERFMPPIDAQNLVVEFIRSTIGAKIKSDNATIATAARGAQSSVADDKIAANATRAIITVQSGGWVRVEHVSVAEAEKLLHADFQIYEKKTRIGDKPLKTSGSNDGARNASSPLPVSHASSASFIRSPSGYSLPSAIASVVDFVGGVTKLPGSVLEFHAYTTRSHSGHDEQRVERAKQGDDEAKKATDISYTVNPAFLRTIYNIPSSARGTDSPSIRQVVPQFLEQYYTNTDLQMFQERNGLPPQNISRTIGVNNIDSPGGEASLDVQMITGIGVGVRTEVWSFSGRRDNTLPPTNTNQEPFLDWLLLLAATPDPPIVHSVSYADDEKDCTGAYMTRVDIEFQKAAARGITLLFASGDDGVGSVDVRTDASSCVKANPTFPSSSPWITSIGGTQLAPLSYSSRSTSAGSGSASSMARRETVCSSKTGCIVTTGGGFSDHFPRPAYQNRLVTAYLNRSTDIVNAGNSYSTFSLPPLTWFNPSGRGYPDISALATNYEIFIGGRRTSIGGTSASSPVVAGMISLLNEQLFAQGKQPLGFINPWAYQVAEYSNTAFNDVTEGDNACSQLNYACCPFGFVACPKWDAVSGVGTINFGELANKLQGLTKREE